MTKEEAVMDQSPVDEDGDFSEAGDISGDGGVMKEIVTHGVQGWQKPENGDDVQMHYCGTLLDGTQFDSSYDRNTPFSFKLGDGKVIKGWDIVARTMSKGEKAKVTLKPEYAYGASGSPPKIPADATLVFEMELLSWTSKRDLFGDGSVLKTEIATGEGWERPGKLAEVTVSVVASAVSVDGKVVGAELYSGQVTFTLGGNQAPPAWEMIVPDMKKECTISLLCKAPHLAGPGVDYVPEGTKAVKYELTMNSWRKIEDIHGDGTLVKKILKEGDGWERPNEGAEVTISGKFKFPSKSSKLVVPPPEGEPIHIMKDFSFKVGDGVVIDGLDRIVQSMKANESAVAAVAPVHAYETAPNLITKDLAARGVTVSSTMLIELTLNKFEKSKDVWSMSFEEKIKEMEERKLRGNELYTCGRYATAKKSYDRAVAFFDSPTSELSPELKAQVNDLLVRCHLNLAACLEKIGDIQKVMNHCKKALEIQPSNVKALYRQGCAYMSLEDYYNASSTFKYALQLSPGNLDVRRKMKELKAKRMKQDAADKKLFSNMFGRMSKLEEKEKRMGKHVSEEQTTEAADATMKVEKQEGKASADVEMKPAEGESMES